MTNLVGPRRLSRILTLTAVLGSLPAGAARAERPTGWFGGGQGYELTADRSVKHEGKASGSVKATDAEQAAMGFGTLTQAIKAEKYRGKRLRMSAYVRTDDVDRQAGLWMRVDGKEKVNLAFDNMTGREIKGTTDWKKYEIVLDIPESADGIFFGFLVAGKGQGWVDDIKFEVVDKDVKTTGLEIQPAERVGEAPMDLPGTPKNLDFEEA